MKLFNNNPNHCQRKNCGGGAHTNRDEINPRCKECKSYITLDCCCHEVNCEFCPYDKGEDTTTIENFTKFNK